MRKLLLTVLTSALFCNAGWSQTLFTYGDHAVTKQEFLRNYEKNALHKKLDFSEQALRDYLNLYALFRMKVTEANRLKLDTLPGIQRELDSYRKQLAKNYLTDEEVTNKLYREAYNRMKEERRVAHILITLPPNAKPEDTLKAYHLIDSLYNQIVKKKADFAALAKLYSQDMGTKDHGGDIGFITALQTLYPFENAVYNTEPGKVSAPFRTQLGYHIVKVLDKEPNKGYVQVAQILLTSPESKGEAGRVAARKKADSIYAALKKGASFDALVKKYSDDKFTADKGGVMKPFGVGETVPQFEMAAFALKKPGDISEPIPTSFGFHIIKLIEKIPLQPYDSLQDEIKRKVATDSRGQLAQQQFIENVKQKNGFKEYPKNLDELIKAVSSKIPDTGKEANLFHSADFNSMRQPLFQLGGNTYNQNDFLTFAESMTRGRILGDRSQVLRTVYQMYVDRVVNDFQEHKLVDENPEFRSLMDEYRDGIMLFELMDREIWGKASRDSSGLLAFFEANKGKYQWEPGFSGTVYRFKDQQALDAGLKLMRAKKPATDEAILEALNKEGEAVTIQKGRYEFSHFNAVPKDQLKAGKLSDPVKGDDGYFTVVKVSKIFPTNTPKTLEDARGYVISEYQDFLEKNWNKELKENYPLSINEEVFQSMVK